MKQSTKEEVTQVLMDMLYKTPLEELRVKDLCERAGISKSSFYRMFQDKYEAANYIYKRIADDIVQSMPDLSKHGEWGAVLCEYILQHKSLFRNIFSYHGQNSFEEFLSNYYYGNCLRYRKHPDVDLSDEQKFAMQAYCFLAAHDLATWALSGYKIDHAEKRRLLHLCIPECVREYL